LVALENKKLQKQLEEKHQQISSHSIEILDLNKQIDFLSNQVVPVKKVERKLSGMFPLYTRDCEVQTGEGLFDSNFDIDEDDVAGGLEGWKMMSTFQSNKQEELK